MDPLLALQAGHLAPGTVPFAAGDANTTGIFLALFVLLAAAKVGEEIFRRLRQPGIVGELIGGFIVGPYALGLVSAASLEPGGAVAVFAELGAVILLFYVGLEVRTDDLLSVGKPALATALIGMLLPVLAGVGVGLVLDVGVATSAFFGLALAATSIGITSRALAEMGVLDRRFARIVLGAAIVDDILALILIGVVTGVVEGDLSASTLLVALSGVGLVVLGFVVARRVRGLPKTAFTWPLFADTPLVVAFLLMLALAIVSSVAGLAAIIGAFVAGLIIAETEAQHDVEHETRTLVTIFVPFFFAYTGARVDIAAFLEPEVVVISLALGVLGVLTKAIGGIVGAWSAGRWTSVAVGFGMVPRGEVGIVVAGLGVSLGILSTEGFNEVLAAVVITTIAAPFLLRFAVPRALREPGNEPQGEPGTAAA
ncbi:MAG: cation:proton antiporter [Chloroflexi bacterium]|jgi:Kef-type K+ transport system membrane component KefB|nr:cation:proton antiporter [Chloroflexota bacterium]